MSSLQIRNLPDDIYQSLSFRAEREHRSLAQQAIVELRRMTGGASRERRLKVLKEIKDSMKQQKRPRLSTQPDELIRNDRER